MDRAALLHPVQPRHDLDFYATPSWCADIGAVIATPSGVSTVLDPCAGDGALLDAIRRRNPNLTALGIELDPIRAAACGATVGDALSAEWNHDWPTADCVLMNPPFNAWQPFVDRAMSRDYWRVVVLLRMGALAGQKRREWWRRIADSHGVRVHILSRRPSFTGGGTDGCDYCWVSISRHMHEEGIRWV